MRLTKSSHAINRHMWLDPVLAAALAISTAASASASSFTVNPTQIVLRSNATSMLLTLRNEGDTPLRFQLSVFAWDQGTAGEMRLQPTDDIVFFPPLLTVSPKQSRNVRVGAVTTFANAEKTYRIFVEELPSDQNETEHQSVHVLTKMGIPIFLLPSRLRAEGSLRGLAMQQGVFSFSVYNAGNVHFLVQSVRLRGLGSGDEPVFDRALDGWYILAEGIRAYEVPIPPSECSRIRAFEVAVQVGASLLEGRLDAPSEACAP
jgi:fimbrial chaperone protein